MFDDNLCLPNEAFCFGGDEYLKIQVNLAECLMKTENLELAVEKYESVKKRIQ